MSAWLCNEEHIYEMAHYYIEHVTATTMSVDKIAKILYDANVFSLVCRYGDDEEDMPMDVLSHYRPIVTNPIHMAKLINCYDYQSCESDTWEESNAYAMCERMLESLNLPKDYSTSQEYNDAPWGFEQAAYARKLRIRKLETELDALRAAK